MGRDILKHLALAGVILFSLAAPVAADEGPSAAVMEQIVLSEKLIAMGKARNDALLILAAIRLRASLDGENAEPGGQLTSRKDAFAAANTAAANDPALLEIVKDVEASSSRRMPICARNGVCF